MNIIYNDIKNMYLKNNYIALKKKTQTKNKNSKVKKKLDKQKNRTKYIWLVNKKHVLNYMCCFEEKKPLKY